MHPILKDSYVKGKTLKFIDGKLIIYNDIYDDDNGHGTAITGIIVKETEKCNILREKFLMNEYRVGQIGSEPQSLLFGILLTSLLSLK